ncbi:MAG TPA: 1,4-dihydroxy-6-naphthoate synthase [Chitinophagaceae bacterium]|nr:1,4-dihydroxy-6-naphthoate synthase [Chitinophagaceae bacterium]
MEFTLGFSPCPNDTFIFDALVNKKIDTENLHFNVVLEDVETLNQWAFEGKLDVSKLSYPAFFQNTNEYGLLNAGAALGKGVGPILITNHKQGIKNDEVGLNSIALPGINTTANLLFSFAYPEATNKKFMLFSDIEDAVFNKQTDLGVIIHENRFTYQQKGLKKVKDLGEYWEEKTGQPIPLGGIAAKRSLGNDVIQKINSLIRKSLEFANRNWPSLPEYVTLHAQEMSEDVMRQHIQLYVNDYSLELGDRGRQAVQTLYNTFSREIIEKEKNISHDLFLF